MSILADRVVVISGAAGGIGRAMVAAFEESGAKVAGLDVDAAGAAELAASHPCGTFVVADVADRDAVEAAVARVLDRFGRIYVVVANAGCTVHAPFADTTFEQINRVLRTNLYGTIHLVRAVLPHLAEGSHVVAIASLAGFVGFPFQSIYSASKFAVVGLAEALRAELAARDIGVSVLLPGTVATGFLEHVPTTDSAMRDRLAALMRRFGTSPHRIAAAAVDAVHARRPRVVLGPDARIAAALHRLAPGALPAALAAAAKRLAMGARDSG